jgi:chemotaxis protein histidine kinase CheA
MSITRVKKLVEECGKLYNFNAEEALRALNIEVMEKKEKVVVSNSKYPLPFNGEKKENCCNGIVKNHGLYTQCSKKTGLGEDGENKKSFCKGCENEPYGNIDERVKVGLYEYKDPKGKSPKRYTEVLKKLKITKETIEEEAKRLNITILPIHFEEVEENVKRGRPKSEKKVKEPTGKKGRPKKENKVLEVNNEEEEDLFATLIAKANANQPLEKVEPNPVQQDVTAATEEAEEVVTAAEEVVEEVLVEESKEVPSPKAEKKAKKVKEVDTAKEAEKQKKAEEKEAKEAAKEAEKQKKAEEKAAKEAEKQKKAEEKAAKEAEKQKKAEEKAAKEQAKEAKKNSKDLTPSSPKVDEEEADVVQKIEFEGKPYYKSKKNGIIYNMEQEVVGKWNTERKAIDFEEEEEEEEYDD